MGRSTAAAAAARDADDAAPLAAAAAAPQSAAGAEGLTLWTCLATFPLVAAQASWAGAAAGVPFGGCLGWLLVVICANDSGEYPWAPLLAAVVGWPVAAACDVLLLLPALAVRAAAALRRTPPQ